MENTVKKFGMKDKIGYAMGDFGCNLSFSLISTYMYIFYTQYIGLTSATWGVIILLLKIWDAVNDPLIGSFVDSRKYNGKSRFKPWIKYGSIGLIFGASLFFLPVPNAPYWLKVLICVGTYLLWDICYTVVNVPYGAMNSTISGDVAERASLSTWRTVGAAVGAAACMALPYVVYNDDNSLRGEIFIWVAVGFGIVALVAFWLLRVLTTERVAPVRTQDTFKLSVALKGFVKNRPLIAISITSVASIVFLTSTLTTNNIVFQCYFKDTDKIFLATLAAYLPMMLVLPFATKIARKFGKKLSIGLSLLISAAACVVMLLVRIPADQTGIFIWIGGLMAVNLGAGLFNVLCWAVVSDCIDYQQWKSSQRSEGSTYAVYSLFRKLAQGIGASFIAFALAAVGYNEALGANQTPEVASNIVTLSISLILAGAVIMSLSMLFIYNLDKDTMALMQKALGREQAQIDLNDAFKND